jgi:exopolyphosphatase/pppGpp-phosphohydrolase
MKQLKLIFITLFLCGLANLPLLAQDIVRAAIDFGSGAVKIQIAEVDNEENCIKESYLAKYVSLGLVEDVAIHNGFISDAMVQTAINILQEFKEEALAVAHSKGHDEVHFKAIATAVFRKAHNGIDLLQLFEDKLGIRFQILPQDEEGKLGFLTAKALYPEVPEKLLLAWDSGNGSFQISDMQEVYEGPLGHGTVRVLLSKEIRQGPILTTHESGNPVLREESSELAKKIKELLPTTPDWLQEKLNSDSVVVATFGDGEAIFSLVAEALAYLEEKQKPVKHTVISFSDVQKVIDAFIEKGDDVFNEAGLHVKTLTSAVHLSTIMKHFNIGEIHYKRTVGNTSGMLIAPQLWSK